MSDYFYLGVVKERELSSHSILEWDNRSQRELRTCVDLICARSLERLDQPLTLEEMERMTGYSRRSIINAFHDRFGCSPCKWQQSVRLRMAHSILSQAEGMMRIGNLAWELGFPSFSKFCSYYRRMFDETPKQTIKRVCHISE